MRYIIWGFTEDIKKIADEQNEIVGFADNNIGKVGLYSKDREVMSANKAKYLFDEEKIDGVIIPDCLTQKSKFEILLQLNGMGITGIYHITNGIITKYDKLIEANKEEKRMSIAIWAGDGAYYKLFINDNINPPAELGRME